ncbi:phenylacetate--CoA ligase family protein [Oryzobacter sp. R7]|uniref:phenylacetate--CoA ligase family protein n=1 Tax=Oryzobacter faecalis TaxID=3388656 RepID=UPI00398D2742
MARVLRARREIQRREPWPRERLVAHRERALRELRQYALHHSPFYRRFHRGFEDAPLAELPVLSKAVLMEHFDEVVTDPSLHLRDLRAFLRGMAGGERYEGRYYVAATAGTTGHPGLFAWSASEWAAVLASYSRPYAWGGVRLRLTRRTPMAVVSSTTPWHQSALVGATVDSRFLPTLRIDSGSPLDEVTARLDSFRPEVLVGYASMLRVLAAEQEAGRLHITPAAVFSASEVLGDGGRRAIETAWGSAPFDVYAATETAGIGAECEAHRGLHLFEDLVVVENVDDRDEPVDRGSYGHKVLVSVLGSRTLPLIRYELTDSVRLTADDAPCPCGRAFTRIDGIQGREEDALRLPAPGGAEVLVQPAVFHAVMDTVDLTGWQVAQEDDGLTVRVTGLAPAEGPVLGRALRVALTRAGAADQEVRVHRVERLARTPLGKVPLIRAARPR